MVPGAGPSRTDHGEVKAPPSVKVRPLLRQDLISLAGWLRPEPRGPALVSPLPSSPPPPRSRKNPLNLGVPGVTCCLQLRWPCPLSSLQSRPRGGDPRVLESRVIPLGVRILGDGGRTFLPVFRPRFELQAWAFTERTDVFAPEKQHSTPAVAFGYMSMKTCTLRRRPSSSRPEDTALLPPAPRPPLRALQGLQLDHAGGLRVLGSRARLGSVL